MTAPPSAVLLVLSSFCLGGSFGIRIHTFSNYGFVPGDCMAGRILLSYTLDDGEVIQHMNWLKDGDLFIKGEKTRRGITFDTKVLPGVNMQGTRSYQISSLINRQQDHILTLQPLVKDTSGDYIVEIATNQMNLSRTTTVDLLQNPQHYPYVHLENETVRRGGVINATCTKGPTCTIEHIMWLVDKKKVDLSNVKEEITYFPSMMTKSILTLPADKPGTFSLSCTAGDPPISSVLSTVVSVKVV